MGQLHNFNKSRSLVRHIFLGALSMLILTGCSGSLLGTKSSESNTIIWKHRDQYVRIEAQDRGDTPPPANDHPTTLSPQLLREMLSALEVDFDNKGKPAPVFTQNELEILCDAFSEGLAKASPREDVTFAIAGVHRGMISFTTDRSYLTGRIFFQQGKLNLIIGDLHEEYRDNIERRLYPLVPGSRKNVTPDPRRPAPRSYKVLPLTGLQTQNIAGTERHDWLVMTPDPQLWKAVVAERKEAKETAKDAFREASQVRQESAQVSAEQERLRAELEALKKDMKSIKQAPVAAPAMVQPAQPQADTSLKMRLRQLKDLRDEELITEDEYRAKRQEILDNL